MMFMLRRDDRIICKSLFLYRLSVRKSVMDSNSQSRILIIDDMLSNIMILKKGLQNSGYQVFSALNGREGVILARKHQPDLILLDIMMPEEDGYQVIARLKETPETAHIPVIFLTAREDMESKLRGFDSGAVDYVTKPFNIHEIRARVRVHIQMGLATRYIVEHQSNQLRQLHEAQNAILVKPQDIPEAGFGIVYESLAQAGGDFYEVIQLAPDIFGFFVGDVSGHDIATSFVTPALKALLRQNCKVVFSPMETMRMINGVLTETLPSGKYLTACYLLLNRKMRSVTIINMAHPPLVSLPLGGKAQLLNMNGDVLGAFSDVAFGETTLKVMPKDRFFIYSDGVIERQKSVSVWTRELDILLIKAEETAHLPIQEAVLAISTSIEKEKGKADDDVLILGIEV